MIHAIFYGSILASEFFESSNCFPGIKYHDLLNFIRCYHSLINTQFLSSGKPYQKKLFEEFNL